MSSKTDKRKENGFFDSAQEGGAATVFTGPHYASSSKYVSLTGEGGYDDDIYGTTGGRSTQYLSTEVNEEDEVEIPSMEGSSARGPFPRPKDLTSFHRKSVIIQSS